MGAGSFGVNIERNSFVGLNVNNEAVWGDVALDVFAEEKKGRAAETDDDLRGVGSQAFAAANVKRNLRPTPGR